MTDAALGFVLCHGFIIRGFVGSGLDVGWRWLMREHLLSISRALGPRNPYPLPLSDHSVLKTLDFAVQDPSNAQGDDARQMSSLSKRQAYRLQSNR